MNKLTCCERHSKMTLINDKINGEIVMPMSTVLCVIDWYSNPIFIPFFNDLKSKKIITFMGFELLVDEILYNDENNTIEIMSNTLFHPTLRRKLDFFLKNYYLCRYVDNHKLTFIDSLHP